MTDEQRPDQDKDGKPVYIVEGLGCVVAALAVLAAIFFPLFAKARESARQTTCMSSLKLVAQGFALYSQDHEGKFPPVDSWNKHVLDDYMRNFRDFCPDARNGDPTYAMNLSLNGMTMKQVRDPKSTVMVYESVTGWNLAGGPELLPSPPRHSGGNNFSFVDGHAKWHKNTETSDLQWKP